MEPGGVGSYASRLRIDRALTTSGKRVSTRTDRILERGSALAWFCTLRACDEPCVSCRSGQV
eukprot:1379515-Rhodomonas_salina.6